ncbi:MAG: DUF4040 domain-containing protein [Candidatus Omnitrophica bacterium]|nr:DUF4040 domain-containing protein [Candidatus Omnitrophota bacterium]
MSVLIILLILMIAASILAVELEDLIGSVVALFALGLFLSITFIMLKAPDVAIMQLIVETLGLVVLVKATSRVDLPLSTSGRWYLNTFIYTAFLITLLLVASKCFKDLPFLSCPVIKASSGFSVSEITLKYRIFDSFGEAAILFVAVIAILAILRPKGKKHEDPSHEKDEAHEKH